MEYVAFFFGILGLFAFLNQSSLKKRVADLEKQMRALSGTDYAKEMRSLHEAAQGLVGQTVKLGFREDEEDSDVLAAALGKGACTLVDVDSGWLLVRIEHHGVVKEKLLRLDALKSIGV